MARILVVDDEKDVVEPMAICLESRGHKVEGAYSGKECLKKVRKRKPDLIVLDIKMPGMNGVEVLRSLRTDLGLEQIPVIMLTAITGDYGKPDGFWRERIGVEDFISKPFQPLDFLEHVDDVLTRKSARDHRDSGRFVR